MGRGENYSEEGGNEKKKKKGCQKPSFNRFFVELKKHYLSFALYRMVSALWARYESFLDEYPLLGRSLTAASIAGASDAVAQSISAILAPPRQRATVTTATSSNSQARRIALWCVSPLFAVTSVVSSIPFCLFISSAAMKNNPLSSTPFFGP